MNENSDPCPASSTLSTGTIGATNTVPIRMATLEEMAGIAAAPAIKDAEEALAAARVAEVRKLREELGLTKQKADTAIAALVAERARWLESLLEIRAALQAVRDRDGPVLGTIWMRDRPETVVAFIDHLRSICRDSYDDMNVGSNDKREEKNG